MDWKPPVPIVCPFSCVVSGQTFCGKTQWVAKLLQNQDVLDKPFDRVIYSYSIMQPAYRQLQSSVQGFELVEGFPKQEIEDLAGTESVCVVLDDLMCDIGKSVALAKLFTTIRHKNVSIIFLVQNLYHGSGYFRDCTRNAGLLVLFRNNRDSSMIATLSRQVFPEEPRFVYDAFKQTTSHNYIPLILDLRSSTERRFRVREGIFKDENHYLYLPTQWLVAFTFYSTVPHSALKMAKKYVIVPEAEDKEKSPLAGMADMLPLKLRKKARIIVYHLADKLQLDQNHRVVYEDNSKGSHIMDLLRYWSAPKSFSGKRPLDAYRFAALMQKSGVPEMALGSGKSMNDKSDAMFAKKAKNGKKLGQQRTGAIQKKEKKATKKPRAAATGKGRNKEGMRATNSKQLPISGNSML